MKLFITGGAGFIGINFVQHWLNKHPKDEITIYDKLTQYANVNEVMELSHSNSNLSLVIDDLLNFPRLQDLIRNYDVVVHFAAETHVDDSIKNPKLFIDTNVLGTSNLLLSTIGTDIEKIIYVSTDEVFGQSDTDEFNEHTSVNPRNPYSATKASAEMLAMAYHNTYKVPFIITNAVNNYGPHQYPNKLIPKFILRSLNNLSLPVYGDGKQQREWLYVTDHCRAIEYIIEKGDIGNRYCIGTGYKKENIEIVNEILTKTGRDATLIEHIIDRPGHDKSYEVNSSKIRSLGWKPEVGFQEGMQMTIDWYTHNSRRWQIDDLN
ncbi:dTDP-glucose 4,6-dehydratase [candidate division WWE3 bacterium]|uniref:dTDP-glucose 4,6-dehydratase n=1 Tax=candidate division WWE3 bacterium TaxID=2053526 RepID=A0A955LKA0_UNCKA|nr:dTDP-glucose 4,6-dehydratase [candidate division WWE3 bacterium]